MNININSSYISSEISTINSNKKILIAGPALSTNKAREIMLPANKEEALNAFGQSELYKAYELLKDLGVDNVYLSNCYNRSDYIRLSDKIIHYDFDYFIPINIYLSDKFYNPLIDKDQYYAEYFLEQLSLVNSLTTVIMTEKHASLYEDFDHYTSTMTKIETKFMEEFEYDKSIFLEQYGNNLNFVYNNLNDIPYSNVVLGALYVIRDYSKYLSPLSGMSVVFDLDHNDIQSLRAMYFKTNYYAGNTTIENPMNFRKNNDIYANALIDDVIKRAIKSINLEKYKGRLYNQYIAIQIESDVVKALNSMKGKLFKEYTINKIGFKKSNTISEYYGFNITDPTAGYIIIDYSFIPYGTLESIDVIMGV